MSNRPFLLLVVLFVLGTVCFALPYAVTSSEYHALLTAPHATGTVVGVEPWGKHIAVRIKYQHRGPDSKLYPEELTTYPVVEQAASFAVGEPVDLIDGRETILPDKLSREAPSPILLAGAIACALGLLGSLVLHVRLRLPRDPRTALEVIGVALARTRNVRLAGAMMFTMLGALFAVVPFADAEGSAGERLGIGVLALATLGVAGVFARIAYRLRDVEHNPIVDLIEHRSQDIAWFYVQRTRGRYGVEVTDAMIWKTDRKVVSIRVVPKDSDIILAELARRAPHAARGYSVETEKLYRANPVRWNQSAAAASS